MMSGCYCVLFCFVRELAKQCYIYSNLFALAIHMRRNIDIYLGFFLSVIHGEYKH